METTTLASVHALPVCDSDGNIVDALYFCSDFCHRQYCDLHGHTYGGWNGCHEVDDPGTCHNCNNALGFVHKGHQGIK